MNETNENKPESTEWAKDWVEKDLITPSPYTPAGASNQISDEALDAQIDELLARPEVSAVLENVAQDASDDIGEAVEEVIAAAAEAEEPQAVAIVTRAEFDAFVTRVEKAFRHAGFKF